MCPPAFSLSRTAPRRRNFPPSARRAAASAKPGASRRLTMMPSDPAPKLPAWIFVVTDVVLVATAAVIAYRTPYPMDTTSVIAIAACVLAGAAALLVPLVASHERRKNELLDERQTALEALARTVASSAEQIGIAAGGLHEIADLTQKNLRHAEHLPHKLQDKIAEFQSQLAAATDAEKEELEKELVALRASESERLESTAAKIAKSAAEWAKLEAATQKNLAAAEHALATAARALGEAGGAAARDLDAAKTAALRELNDRLATATGDLVERFSREITARVDAAAARLDAKLATLEATAHLLAAASIGSKIPAALAAPLPPLADAPAGTGEENPPTADTSPKAEGTAHPPKRPRKPRREEPAAEDPAAPAVVSSSAPATASPASATLATAATTSFPPEPPTLTEAGAAAAPSAAPHAAAFAHHDEPPPVLTHHIVEITPAAPTSTTPFAIEEPHVPSPETDHGPEAAPGPAPLPEEPKRARPRPAKKTAEPDSSPSFDLDDSPAAPTAELTERVLTSDGATRLVVTAYIGIGNRLFIRGEGPGLSWEKGVPLQFVSIGKWRWETHDAFAPVRFKLYKNDDLECTALGAQSLDPGHQQEVTAAF